MDSVGMERAKGSMNVQNAKMWNQALAMISNPGSCRGAGGQKSLEQNGYTYIYIYIYIKTCVYIHIQREMDP